MARWRPPTPEEEAEWYRRIDEGVSAGLMKFTRPTPPGKPVPEGKQKERE